jgi:DNA-directed RNA polymerase
MNNSSSTFCLSKQARHMVIPYMPMLVPPLNWTGYGIHLPVKFYVCLILGSSKQKDIV